MHSGEEDCRRSRGCSGVEKERQNSVLDILVHCSVLDLQVCSLSWQLNIGLEFRGDVGAEDSITSNYVDFLG